MREPAVAAAEGTGPSRSAGAEELTFEVFARTRAARLGRLAQRILADPHHAEDVVQDVLGRVFDRWDRIARLDNPDAYVTRMTVNACTSWWRRAARREHPVDLSAPGGLGSAAVPDGTAALAERDRIRRLLARLPSRQRAVLVLRYLEDLPDPVIAEMLGIREVTVRTNAFHGLGELRRVLAAGDPDLPFDAERVAREGRRSGMARRRRRHAVEAAGGVALLAVVAVVLLGRGAPGATRGPDHPGPTATVYATFRPTTTGAALVPVTGSAGPTATPGGTTGTATGGTATTEMTTTPTTTSAGGITSTTTRTTRTSTRASATTSTTTRGTTTTTPATPAAGPRAVVGVGASALEEPGCEHPSCHWVTVRLSGLQPGTAYVVSPHDDTGLPAPSPREVTTGADGTYRNDREFYFGFPGRQVWVTVGPVVSNRVTWPS